MHHHTCNYRNPDDSALQSPELDFTEMHMHSTVHSTVYSRPASVKMWKQNFAKKTYGFQKGHNYYAPYRVPRDVPIDPPEVVSSWARLPRDEFQRVAKSSPDQTRYEVPDAEGNQGSAKLLRPLRSGAPVPTLQYLEQRADDTCGEMRLVHRDKMCDMFNRAITQHAQHAGRSKTEHGDKCDHSYSW